MNISLTNELVSFIHTKVKSGMYHSASEVVREGLRLLKGQDALQEHKLRQLRQDINVGVRQLDKGESSPLDMDSVIARVHRQAKKR